MELQDFINLANQNQGFLAIILFIIALLITWLSGFLKWAFSKFTKNNIPVIIYNINNADGKIFFNDDGKIVDANDKIINPVNINQKNIFGSNNLTINVQPTSRTLESDQKQKIINRLKEMKVSSVALQFEYSGETQELAQNVASFLKSSGFNVYGENDKRIASGIKRGEFSLSKHPADSSFAIIRIGSIS